jgi:hypothetical protein
MPQQSRPTLTLPIVANGAIAQYRGVGFNQAQATVAGQKIMGFSRRPAANGGELDLSSKGTAIAETGGAIAVGAALAVDASGRVVMASALAVAVGTLAIATGATAVTSSASNGAIVTGVPAVTGGDLPQYVCGYALPGNAAAAAGEFIEILLT